MYKSCMYFQVRVSVIEVETSDLTTDKDINQRLYDALMEREEKA